MTPTIPDEAVHAAKNVMYYANPNDVERALTAAAPFLQGVKVKKLEWVDKIDSDGYINCHAKTPFGRYDVYHFKFSDRLVFGWDCAVLGIKDIDADSIEAAAQADYEARILSALEPFANSYPQGANLAAHSKNENGPDHEPSPRAQALEEALRNLLHAVCGETGFANAVRQVSGLPWPWPSLDIAEAAAIRALSQPVADHIANAGKMVADGWLPIENEPDNEQGPFLVTNNPSALNAFGRPSHVWCVSGIYKEKDGSFCAFEGNQKIHGLLMFMPVTAPLPASPGASE